MLYALEWAPSVFQKVQSSLILGLLILTIVSVYQIPPVRLSINLKGHTSLFPKPTLQSYLWGHPVIHTAPGGQAPLSPCSIPELPTVSVT